MPITSERTIAQAIVNDAYGVELWQEHKTVDYTPEEARELAAEILKAADEADAIQFPSIPLEPTKAEAILIAAFGFDREEAAL